MVSKNLETNQKLKVIAGVLILIVDGILAYSNVLGKIDPFNIENMFLAVIVALFLLALALTMLFGFPYGIYLIYKGVKK